MTTELAIVEEAENKKRSKQALEGKRINAYAMDPSELVIIGLDTNDGKEHPLYDLRAKQPLKDSFVKNIRKNGVRVAVLVRKNGDKTEVVAGRQRVKAARLVNEELKAEGCEPIFVTVMLVRGGDDTAMGIMISENEQRTDDEIFSKLDKLERYLALGRTEEDASIQFGVGVQTIKNWLLLLEAGPEVKKAVKNGQLSSTAGCKIAALSREAQAAAVEEMLKDGPVKGSTEKAARLVKVKKANDNSDGDEKVIHPPGKRLLKKVVEAEFAGLSDEQTLILRWVLGDVDANRVKGLTGLLRKIDESDGAE